ncbi:hypothetical protein D3C84_899920 [compost metagenome]
MPGTDFAAVHDVAAHLRQHRLQGGEQFGGGADHEGQGAGRRATGTTGNRCIGHAHALFGCCGGDIAGGLRIDGAAIHGRHALGDPGQHAVFTQPDAAHMHGGRQHGDHQFCTLRGLTGRRTDGTAQLRQLREHGFVQVDQVQRMAGLDQVARHRRAHVAETDKSDFHVRLLNAN